MFTAHRNPDRTLLELRSAKAAVAFKRKHNAAFGAITLVDADVAANGSIREEAAGE